MGGLELSDERRMELIQLLDDPDRLQAEYPKVAQYLDLSQSLEGTGNPQVDAAFELRFIHYLTADDSAANPYWEIVAPLISYRNECRIIDGKSANGSSRLAFAQMILQETFAYAVPSPETIRWIADWSNGATVIEAGAGRGYWAAQLASIGVEVAAFDIEPPDSSNNISFPVMGKHRQTWHKVHETSVLSDSYRDASGTILFLCWPPGWGDKMASESLQWFEDHGGSRLIYAGEPKGGKTANDQFFSALSDHWSLSSSDSEYVSWWNLSDHAQFWTRNP